MSQDAYRTSRGADPSLMDELLRGGVPEIKLALGQVIDRENARPLPARYARLLPDAVLTVTLRDDAAEALLPIAAEIERELTDSCNRHGSLYDRSYRVRLQRSTDPDAPLYAVAALAGKEEQPPGEVTPDDATGTQVSPRMPATMPEVDPDATRLDGVHAKGWESGRWVLVVEGDEGEEREVFRISEPLVTVGRGTDDPRLRSTIAISDAPHVSRRQLALVWEERDGAPGFKVFNLGLNAVHLPGQDVPGAHAGREALDLGTIEDRNTAWLPPGVPLRIGEQGPSVRIDEVPPDPDDIGIDPDATVFE